MRPSSTKSCYIISHLDLSKSAAKSKPPRDVGAARACSASIFTFFNFLHKPLIRAVFCHRGFFDEAVRKRDGWLDETPVHDSQTSHRVSTVDAQELEASAVNAT
jgi:hypothetical protein